MGDAGVGAVGDKEGGAAQAAPGPGGEGAAARDNIPLPECRRWLRAGGPATRAPAWRPRAVPLTPSAPTLILTLALTLTLILSPNP